MAGKGSQRRPCQLSREAEDLQWALYEGRVTFKAYEQKRQKLLSENKWWRR